MFLAQPSVVFGTIFLDRAGKTTSQHCSCEPVPLVIHSTRSSALLWNTLFTSSGRIETSFVWISTKPLEVACANDIEHKNGKLQVGRELFSTKTILQEMSVATRCLSCPTCGSSLMLPRLSNAYFHINTNISGMFQ